MSITKLALLRKAFKTKNWWATIPLSSDPPSPPSFKYYTRIIFTWVDLHFLTQYYWIDALLIPMYGNNNKQCKHRVIPD